MLCKTSAKFLLTDAHFYGGATLSSDHKPVVPRLQFAYIPLVQRQGPTKYKALYDLYRLTSDSSLHEVYCEDLNDHVIRIPDPWLCKTSAETTIGRLPVTHLIVTLYVNE